MSEVGFVVTMYIKAVAGIFLGVILFGGLIPYMISAANWVSVVAGFALLAITLLAYGYFVYDFIKDVVEFVKLQKGDKK